MTTTIFWPSSIGERSEEPRRDRVALAVRDWRHGVDHPRRKGDEEPFVGPERYADSVARGIVKQTVEGQRAAAVMVRRGVLGAIVEKNHSGDAPCLRRARLLVRVLGALVV